MFAPQRSCAVETSSRKRTPPERVYSFFNDTVKVAVKPTSSVSQDVPTKKSFTAGRGGWRFRLSW